MHLRHKPGPRNGTKVAAYCYAKLTDGEAYVVLPWAEVLKVRDASQGYKNAKSRERTDNPWMTHEDAMARKTALRALANRGELPISVELMQAAEVDEAPVDFASFAKDPDAGAVIDGTASEVDEDGVVEEEKQPAQQEQARQQDAPRQEQRAARQPASEKPKAAAQEKGTSLTPARLKELEDMKATILMDAEMNAADARDYHKDKIAALKAEAPALYEDLEEELAQFEKAQADQGQEG